MVIDLDTNKYKAVDPERVVGAKAGQEPRKPVIANDSVASISTAKILYGLSEGEISGIVGNAKGIYLENTPLQDDSGNNNFENVVYDFRSGTVDQTYIKGFPDVSNELPVNVELKSSTAWIKAINKTELSAVRIRLAWNGLKSQNLDNGDVSGYKIEYAVDVKTDTGAYVEVLKTFINDKVSGKYERTHRIDLPKASTGWQIRVRRLTANQNKENIVDKMFVESITEVIDIKLRYPNTALLGLQYDAKTFSRIAKIAVRARGKLISIPTNYDTTTGTYVGLWNGTFKQVYSNNPAWIFYDIVTSKRYGLGKRIDKSMLDKWSIYSLGVYCDELIADGEGGLEKRFTCNVYLQSQADAFKVLQQLSGIFRSLSYWNGEQIVLDADVPKDPVYTFSRANVVDGNFEYSGTRARDRHTVAKVAFDNPNEGYKTEYEYIRDEAGIAKFGINIVDISAIGCTSRAQAQRAGLWALKSEQLETRTVSFKTGLEGFIPQVGNIIEVSDELLAGRANGGRIASVSDNGKVVTLDREITVAIDDFIIVNGKDGISQRRKVINVSGRIITVLAPFEDIESGAVYAIRAVDLDTMKFRVMTIKPDDSNVFSITALQHEPLKYNAIDYGTDVKPTNISNRIPTSIEAPKTVSLSSTNRVVQGQNITTLTIQWSQVKEAVAYSVEWRRDSGNWIKAPNTGNVSLDIEGVYEGNYLARVSAINAFDVASLPTTSMLTNIKGKVGKPKALGFIKATGVLFGMQIKWGFNTGSEDTSHTEIQVATDALGTNTALLGMFSYPTDKTEVTGLQGGLTVFYRGRTVDKLGNFSDWSQWVSGTTDDSADKVLELLEGQITESQLFTDLKTKIDKIDTNESSLDGLGVDLTAANQAIDKAKADIIEANRVIDANKAAANLAISEAEADIVEANRVIEANRTAANLSIEAANKLIADNKTALDLDLEAANAEIAASRTELNTAKTQLSTAINTANTEIADSKLLIDANKAKLVLTDAEVAAAKTKVTALETDYNGNKTSVSNALTVLTNKDKSLASDISTLSANYGASEAKLVQDLKVLTDKDVALTNSVTTLSSSYEANKSKVATDITTLVNKDTALNNLLTTLDSDYKTNKASVSNSLTTLSDKDIALTNSITTLESEVEGNKASILSNYNTLSDANTATANKLDGVYAQVNPDLIGSEIDLIGNDTKKAGVWSEQSARIEEDLALSIRSDNLESAINDNTATIKQNFTTLVDEDKALASLLTSLEANYNSNKAKIDNELVVLVDKDKALTSSIDTLSSEYNTNKAKIVQDLQTLTDKDVSLTNSLTTLESNFNTNKASIVQDLKTLSDKDISLTSSIDNLNSDYQGNKTKIVQDLKTLTDKDTSLASLITALDSDYKGNKASVSSSLTTLSDKDTALTNQLTTLTSTVSGNTSAITTNLKTLTDKDKALSDSLVLLQADYDGNKTSVSNKLTALTDKDTSLSNSLTALDSDYKGNKTTVSNSLTALSNADTALGTRITTLDTDYKGNKTAIRNELTAVSNKTNSTASSLLTLESEVEGNTASIIANYKTLSDKDTATATKLDGVYAQVNPLLMGDSEALVGNDTKFSGVWSEQSARIEEDLALAIRSDNLQSKLEDNTALISQNFNTLVDKDTSLATLITDLEVDYKGNKSSIRNELTAVSTKTDSTASSLTTLSSEFGGNKTAVQNQITVLNNKDISLGQQIATVESTANGNKSSIQTQTTAINGLSAQWSVKLDVNGYVSGIGQYNNGTTSQFAVNASQFYIADPTSKTASTPFQVLTTATTVNGVVVPKGTYITDGYIKNASIDLAKINTASITNLSAISANIGHFKSAPSGARLEIKDSLLSVYDANNRLRVRLGLW